jgi:ABC-type anion transport system duplicated permease subunit
MARARRAGLALKGLQWFLRAIEFCCAALILGVFSYYLAALHSHGLNIDNYTKSIEGISGAAVLYTLIGLLLLCFVAGLPFFSLCAILMDLAFVGAFIYVAYETRSGARSCSGTITTVFGTGDANSDNTVPDPNGGSISLPSFKQACQLETACFSVSIVAM